MTTDEGEVYCATCPSRAIIDQVFDKWSVLILAALDKGPRRFNSIRRSLEGVTQRALTHALRRLERNGLVTRTVVPSSPISVEYSITPLGRSLQEPFHALYLWTLERQPEIEAAQRAFDSRSSPEEGSIP